MTLLERIIEDARKVPKTIGWKVNNGKASLADEEEVLASGNPELAYRFARDVPGANIKKLEDIVVQDPYWSYLFAQDIPGANIRRLEDIVVQDPEYLYWFAWSYYFAMNVPGANVERLREVCKGTNWAF
jgi:hypothetical protein